MGSFSAEMFHRLVRVFGFRRIDANEPYAFVGSQQQRITVDDSLDVLEIGRSQDRIAWIEEKDNEHRKNDAG